MHESDYRRNRSSRPLRITATFSFFEIADAAAWLVAEALPKPCLLEGSSQEHRKRLAAAQARNHVRHDMHDVTVTLDPHLLRDTDASKFREFSPNRFRARSSSIMFGALFRIGEQIRGIVLRSSSEFRPRLRVPAEMVESRPVHRRHGRAFPASFQRARTRRRN